MSKTLLPFKSFYVNPPEPVVFTPDIETKFVDQSEADRASLKYQLERFGMDSLQHQLQQAMSQFGYADTRAVKSYTDLATELSQANEYFMQLPAKIRKQFGHNPAEFFEAIQNNPKEMYEKGYVSEDFAKAVGVIKPVEPVTPVVEPVTPVETVENSENVSA